MTPQIGENMSDGTIYAGISPAAGKPMYTTPADARNPMPWEDAIKLAELLDAYGHQDWRLPMKDELDVLYSNRAAIGGFVTSGPAPAYWYWSSTERMRGVAWAQRFSDGFCDTHFWEYFPSSVRCVR
jgi:hypothetical protein